MAKTFNEKLLDLVFEIQGTRILNSNWVAIQIDNLYLDAWSRSFPGNNVKRNEFRGITKKVLRIIEAANDTVFKRTWMEMWKGTIEAMPKEYAIAINSIKKLREQDDDEDEDDVPELDPTSAQLASRLPPPISIPRKFPRGFGFAVNLYRPPTQKEINKLNLKTEWDKFFRNRSNENKIISEITKGVTSGLGPPEIARIIRPLVKNDKTRATRIARTETLRMNNAGLEQSVRSALGKTLGAWKYIATLDDKTRPHHAAQDGKVYPEGKTRPLLPDGPNCRCTYSPVAKKLKELDIPELRGRFGPTTRASLNGGVPADTKYSAWFNKQPAETQRKIIGNKRFEQLNKSGRVTWSDFTKSKNSPARTMFQATVKGDRTKRGAISFKGKRFNPN